MRTKSFLISAAALLLLALSVPCPAQWLTQQIPLVPGWNAVYLEVQPEPRSCDEIFRDRAVQSVWKWDRRFSTIQFTLDPATLLPENPDWLMWLPPSDPRAFLNRLFELQGCQAYLVKVASNAAPFTLPLKGRVIIPRLEWYPQGLNLVGLPVNPRNPPTFADFFRFTPQVNLSLGYANQLFRLDNTGRGVRIVQPERERLQPGVAYWVACARPPTAMSGLHVVLQGGAVDFGTLSSAQDFSTYNVNSSGTITFRVRQVASEAAPTTGGFPELAGPVPLSYRYKDTSNQWVWAEFPAEGVVGTLPALRQQLMSLGVRRNDLAPYTPVGMNGATYQSILEITDDAESLLIRVPVVAGASSVAAVMAGHSDTEGLWVGDVVIDKVDAPAYNQPLLPAPAPVSLRLLIHIDSYGQEKLLQQVLLAWDSSLTNAPYTNGAYALYANEGALPTGATDVRRISSVGFPQMAPALMDGDPTNALTVSFTIGPNDPLNPFLHRYHPLHDNKNWSYEPYQEPVESRRITRSLVLQFSASTNTPADPYWGVSALSGTYQETISGLRDQDLHVQGGFKLQRISRINTLITQ